MTEAVLTVGPTHTLRSVAKLMGREGVGAAIVVDPDSPGPSILTERDVLKAVGEGSDLDIERVCDHAAERAVYASPDWSLERAAAEMVQGGFRHLVVVSGAEVVGVLSMRDIVRCWVTDGATSELPA